MFENGLRSKSSYGWEQAPTNRLFFVFRKNWRQPFQIKYQKEMIITYPKADLEKVENGFIIK